MPHFALLFISLFFTQVVVARACLGDQAMCSKKYNEITFLTTHNSFNYASKGELKTYGPAFYLFPNQQRPIQDQLNYGVRAFMLDLHYQKDKIVLCHGGKACDLLGKDFAHNIFLEIKNFLASQQNEIITLILESYISTQDLEKELKKSGLLPYLHCQDPNLPWPTIQEMLDSSVQENKTSSCKGHGRLVLLNDKIEASNPNWNLDLFGTFAVETPYSFKKIKEMTCEFNRGQAHHSLFIFNHFTTLISGKKKDAKKINQFDFLYKRARDCQNHLKRRINFLTIDFYLTGNALEVTKQLNQPIP